MSEDLRQVANATDRHIGGWLNRIGNHWLGQTLGYGGLMGSLAGLFASTGHPQEAIAAGVFAAAGVIGRTALRVATGH